MKTHALWILVLVFLAAIIGYLSWLIFVSPVAPQSTQVVAQQNTSGDVTVGNPSATTTESSIPLSASVVVDTPRVGAMVGQSFVVTGEAPGGWYFEASFPITVRDASGTIIASTQGKAQGDWMQTGQVPFTATTTLTSEYHGAATLILLRDNPSGLPENDDSVSIPITVQ